MLILHSSVVHLTDLVAISMALLDARRDTVTHRATKLYHVAIHTDVSLLSLCSRRRSRAAGLQRMSTSHRSSEALREALLDARRDTVTHRATNLNLVLTCLATSQYLSFLFLAMRSANLLINCLHSFDMPPDVRNTAG